VLPQPPCSPDLPPSDFFLFPKLKSTLKAWFQAIQDYGILADSAMHDPKRGVPGLFPKVAMALGVVHQCRRGVSEGNMSHWVASMTEKIIKKSSKTIWTHHVFGLSY
jgi:hypothetical protein